jgi:UDP-glucose 4-epimerase
MKSAIITGATGMIGMSVAKYLASKEINTIALGGNLSKIDPEIFNFNDKLKYFEISMEEIYNLEKCIEQINWSPEDCVFFNFAWRGNKNISDGTLNEQMKNVLHTANAVKVAKKIGCTKFVNCGSFQETFAEQILSGSGINEKISQMNYTIAKITSRDVALIESYNSKLDYVHTRISVPLSLDLNKESYIQLCLKKILNGAPISEPLNTSVFDFIRLEEVVHAYFLVGENGLNKADYYIGSKTPSTLSQYFSNFKSYVQKEKLRPYERLNELYLKLFSTSQIEIDTKFVPSESFSIFMSEAVKKWRK